MTPAVQRLIAVLGPPRPEVVPVPWDRSPGEIGLRFPGEYCDFIDYYGQISLNGELHIHGPAIKPPQPGASGGFPGFLYRATDPYGFPGFLAQYRASGRHDVCPYPVYPEPGGLLNWANNSNGDHCFWLTEGDDPDLWPIVVVYRAGFEWERFNAGTAEFLLAVATGEYPGSEDLIGGSLGDIDGQRWRFLGDWSGWSPDS
jgi:hypothetical protein